MAQIIMLVRRQLHEEGAAAPGEFVQPRRHPLDPLLRPVQATRVGQAARSFHRQLESVRQPTPPGSEARRRRPPVEAGVELDRVERLDIPAEAISGGQAGAVQDAVPMVVAPTRRADPCHSKSLRIRFRVTKGLRPGPNELAGVPRAV